MLDPSIKNCNIISQNLTKNRRGDNMSVKIIVDRAGFDDFYGLFNTERVLSKGDIDKFFDKSF
jgi:hypothetical protein